VQRTELHEASSNDISMLTVHAEPLRASAVDDLVEQALPFKRRAEKILALLGTGRFPPRHHRPRAGDPDDETRCAPDNRDGRD
jgi:hypothetical protein